MSTNNNSETAPRAARWKNALKNLALAVFVFASCLLVAEAVLRFMGYGNLEIYEPDPVLYWRLKPNQDCYSKVGRFPVHVNQHGTRGRDFPESKLPGTIRVVCIGDSRTFGWGLREEETYPSQLEKLLREKISSQKVEIINAGVNAWTFPQMTAFLRERALKWQPDLVILGDANLWTQFSDRGDPAFRRSFRRRVHLKNFLRRFALYHFVVETRLQEFYAHHRSKFIPVDPNQDALFKEQQQKDPDAFFRESIEQFCRIARTNGIVPVILYLPPEEALTTTNNCFAGVLRAKEQVSARLGVPLVDMTGALRQEAKDLYLDADPVHLNAAGNEIIGRRLFEVVSPFLKP
jgi:lysophospholipase L1-like esterase